MSFRKSIITLSAVAVSGALAAPALAHPPVGHGSGGGGGSTASAGLEAIAQCESGGDPTAIGGGGAFRGKYQFMQSTWDNVAPKGYAGVDPATAPERIQDKAAANLLAQSGTSPWPVCGS
jgi:hypothetical protein